MFYETEQISELQLFLKENVHIINDPSDGFAFGSSTSCLFQ